MKERRKILVVEDDPGLAITVGAALEAEGYAVSEATSAEQAIDRLTAENFAVVLSDIYMERQTGLDVLHRAKALNPSSAVILMTGKGSLDTVIEATRSGAFEYLSKPFSIDRLLDTVRAAFKAAEETAQPAAESPETEAGPLIGNSAAMVEVYKFVSLVAPTDASVLLRGETGTGKELVARMIHEHSTRAKARLVVVDCAALKDTLLETELFGAVRGAYTGADRDRAGLLEVAAGGTAFLDEIGDIEPAFQLRLLRFLQEKEIRPVGSTTSRKVDVRIVAATNRDLKTAVAQGKFREDLWYRLNVASLEIAPLRARPADIPLLVEHFLAEFERTYGRRLHIDNAGLRVFTEYSWPGNARQLRHVLEKLVILTPGPFVNGPTASAALNEWGAVEKKNGNGRTEDLGAVEDEHIRRVLQATGGNKSRAAAILGIERKTLYRKLERMERR